MITAIDIELIEQHLEDYFALQTRDADNSGSISSQWYKKEYDRIGTERGEAYMAMERIKKALGIE